MSHRPHGNTHTHSLSQEVLPGRQAREEPEGVASRTDRTSQSAASIIQVGIVASDTWLSTAGRATI